MTPSARPIIICQASEILHLDAMINVSCAGIRRIIFVSQRTESRTGRFCMDLIEIRSRPALNTPA